MLISELGSWQEGDEWRLGNALGSGCERAALCIPFFLSVLLLILFTSFAVLLNCPYLGHEFCLFLPILLPTPVGGGAIEQPRGSLLPARLNHKAVKL